MAELFLEQFIRLDRKDAELVIQGLQECTRSDADEEEKEAAYSLVIEVLADAPVVIYEMDLTESSEIPVKLKAWMDLISGNIFRLRSERSWSLDELGRQAALPTSYLKQVEKSQRSPSNLVLQKIAKAFGVPLAEIDPTDAQTDQQPN